MCVATIPGVGSADFTLRTSELQFQLRSLSKSMRSGAEHMLDEMLRSVHVVNTVSIRAWDSPGGAPYGLSDQLLRKLGWRLESYFLLL